MIGLDTGDVASTNAVAYYQGDDGQDKEPAAGPAAGIIGRVSVAHFFNPFRFVRLCRY